MNFADFAEDDVGDLLAESNNILNRWKSSFSQLLNIHSVSVVRQMEMHTRTPEPLVLLGPSPFELEIAVEALKRYK
jgi:hypothetical protein